MPLEEVPIDEILEMQREEQIQKQTEEERKKKALIDRGMQPTENIDDMYWYRYCSLGVMLCCRFGRSINQCKPGGCRN